ncbi:MAG: DUF2225 domain-containing protein [Bacillota bacterium]|nr:DUF2225 domain-containing protein [Bacillota bacterium]
MAKNIFSGLENLGFDNIDDMSLYKKKEEEAESDTNKDAKEQLNPAALLYDRTVVCPVCGNTYKAKAVKTSSYRIVKKHSDFFIDYSVINPYFYDVWLCNVCGYAAMKADYNKVREIQKENIQKTISLKWHGRTYPEVYDVNIAIERYKLALLNYTVMEADSSKKAMACLKIAWMYRILNDSDTEMIFLEKALEGFNYAYSNERFPIYNMDKYTLMYLIAELNRRTGNYDEALLWFSNVITTVGVEQKLKEKARDQKDLIREKLQQKGNIDNQNQDIASSEAPKKKGFFSRFF